MLSLSGGITADPDLYLYDLRHALAGGGLRLEVRRSSHYDGGEYLLVELPGNDAAEIKVEHLEQPDTTQFLLHAESDEDEAGDAAILALSRALSAGLSAAGIRHRFEIYAEPTSNEIVEYLHHDWPLGEWDDRRGEAMP